MSSHAASSLLCSGWCLASALRNGSGLVAAVQCISNAMFSTQAQVKSQATYKAASTSGRGGGLGAPAGGAGASSSGAFPSSSSSSPRPPQQNATSTSPSLEPSFPSSPELAPSPAALAAVSSHLGPCRLGQYIRTVLHRELMLKLGPRGWDQVPRLAAVEVCVHTSETHASAAVEKSQLLLYALALETLTGRPVSFIPPGTAKKSATRASGLAVRLDAASDPDAAYGFLEKVVHFILPNQVSFAGVPPPKLMPPPPGYKAATDHRRAPLRRHATEFRVGGLLQYPDFEQNFWLFEGLQGMQVRLEVEGTTAADVELLLSGLSLPMLTEEEAEKALQDSAPEARMRAARE